MVSAKKRIEGMPKSVQEYQGGSSNKDGTEKSSWRHAKQKSKSSAASTVDPEVPRLDIRSIIKDIEHLVPSHLTWKERKNLENKKVVSLGGKPQKKQRLPLSVARISMKNQKEREEKLLQERAILGRFGGYSSSASTKKPEQGRRPEQRVLKSTVGIFRNGILDVKNMLNTSSSQATNDNNANAVNKGTKTSSTKGRGKRKGGGGGGKRKGGGKKRR